MLIIETLYLYLHITNSQTLKLTTMNAKQMIDSIKTQEQDLYNEVQKCLETLGANDPITDSAVTRWATINNLLKTLES